MTKQFSYFLSADLEKLLETFNKGDIAAVTAALENDCAMLGVDSALLTRKR